jgi:hypothetical protein
MMMHILKCYGFVEELVGGGFETGGIVWVKSISEMGVAIDLCHDRL